MANQLGMAERNAIIALAGHGWSKRRIGRELGIHRETGSRQNYISSPTRILPIQHSRTTVALRSRLNYLQVRPLYSWPLGRQRH